MWLLYVWDFKKIIRAVHGTHLVAVGVLIYQEVPTRRAQLSVAAKAVRPTDLLNHVKT